MTLRPSNTRAAGQMVKFSVMALFSYIIALCALPSLIVAIVFLIQSKTIPGCIFIGIYILIRISVKLIGKSLAKQGKKMVSSSDFVKVM